MTTTTKIGVALPEDYLKLHRLYPLAQDTFKQLPFKKHAISEEGIVLIDNLHLGEEIARGIEVWAYTRLLFTVNEEIKENLEHDGKEHFDKELLSLLDYHPFEVYLEGKIHEDDYEEHPFFQLANSDPDFLLTYLTASEWGLNSKDPDVRQGAVVLTALILRNIHNTFYKAKTENLIDKKVKDTFSRIKAIRQALWTKLRDSDFVVAEYAEIVDKMANQLLDTGITICAEVKKKESAKSS